MNSHITDVLFLILKTQREEIILVGYGPLGNCRLLICTLYIYITYLSPEYISLVRNTELFLFNSVK